MITDFLNNEDFTFTNIANTWLSYEAIKHGKDLNGQSQKEVYNKPTTNNQVNEVPDTTAPQTGLSTPVKIGLGVAAAVGLVLLVKK
ncbi:hypothetical protein [Vibrio neptunius]|uniref:hypothetical protein n=1 Tax=Vibrio neptunius TaxID=170651 RepID=UPI003CE488A1